CRGNASFAIAGKEHFDVPQLLVLRQNLRAALFQFARDLRRITFDSEVQITQRGPGHQVAHRSTGQIHIEAHGGGEFLHAHHGRALFRREPAFKQKHIVWHCTPSASGRLSLCSLASAMKSWACRAMRAGDAPCRSASTAPPPHAYKSVWWKYLRGPTSTGPSVGPRHAPAGAWRNCGATCAA